MSQGDEARAGTVVAQERYTTRQEIANVVTHGVGLAASIAAAVVLVVLVSLRGDAWGIVGSCVYGSTLVSLYVASTLYHLSREPRAKRVFRVLDHCAIYLLIAGTYTPFTLVGLRGGWGWTLFGLAWGLAAFGIVFKAFFVGRLNLLSTAAYVLMGWLCVVAVRPMTEALSGDPIRWLLAGGVAYTAGIAFYHNRRVPYSHAVWHLFVIVGSACHYLAISRHLLPLA